MYYNQVDKDVESLFNQIKSMSYLELFNKMKSYIQKFKNDNVRFYEQLVEFYKKSTLWGEIDLDKNIFTLIENRSKSLFKNIDKYEKTYNDLSDYKSKKTFYNILMYWINNDYKNLISIKEKIFDQYFDLDLISCDENEVFIDIGSYIGDTLFSYIKNYGKNNYKKIYCFDIVLANLELLIKNSKSQNLLNIETINKGIGEKNEILYINDKKISPVSSLLNTGEIEVEVVKLDDEIKDDVSFIKMDIEGYEEKALLGCQKIIQNNHPKLAICIYHDFDQLWKIPELIKKIDSTYKFYLRYYGEVMIPGEYVLYAI